MEIVNKLLEGIFNWLGAFVSLILVALILVVIPIIFCSLDVVSQGPEFFILVLYYCIVYGIVNSLD